MMNIRGVTADQPAPPPAIAASGAGKGAWGACPECAGRPDLICGNLGDVARAGLHRIRRRRTVVRGETISRAGDEGTVCATVLSGMFKLSALTIGGREQIVGLLYPTDFVGRPYASRSEYTVTALSDAELCLLPMAAFEGALALHGALSQALLHHTLESLDRARRHMVLLGRPSAEERVAGFLLEMATRLGTCRASGDYPATFELPLSRRTIADVLGLSIETVSRQMSRLRGAGVIALPGGRAVTLLKRTELMRIAAVV